MQENIFSKVMDEIFIRNNAHFALPTIQDIKISNRSVLGTALILQLSARLLWNREQLFGHLLDSQNNFLQNTAFYNNNNNYILPDYLRIVL